jgi:hypothetical protein
VSDQRTGIHTVRIVHLAQFHNIGEDAIFHRLELKALGNFCACAQAGLRQLAPDKKGGAIFAGEARWNSIPILPHAFLAHREAKKIRVGEKSLELLPIGIETAALRFEAWYVPPRK